MRSAEVAASNEIFTRSMHIDGSRFIARMAARIDESSPPEKSTWTEAGLPKTMSGMESVLFKTH